VKSTSKLIIFALSFLGLAVGAHAQSPREQLTQMVEQLQKAPNDNALREKIIQFAPTLKPSPAVPDAAVAFEGRAQFAFRSAKSDTDFLVAAQEYEKAVAAAPWVPGYYSDLCTIYEKAGKYVEAKRHCGFYLIGLTDPTQMTDAKRRIAGLEFGIEKANSQEREIALLRRKQEEKLRTTEGDWYWLNSSVYVKVIQKDGRFEVQNTVNRPNCASNFEATATTIEWLMLSSEAGRGVNCDSRSGGKTQCRLSGETTLDCQDKGFGFASGRESSFQLKRR
jgi:tetratricopeptide (TPR) repeat protein